MAVVNVNLSCELQKPVKVQYLDGNLFSQDSQGNVINVSVLENGEPASIFGTVTADIIRADGGTVAATGGTISGNVASITLPAAAYAIPGAVSIVVKLTDSGVITTIAAVVANIYQSSTDTTIDPGTIIPSVTALISAIETAVASIPADYSSLWTSLAPAFNASRSGGYKVGEFCTNDGTVYICTVDHTGSWNASHFAATNLGDQINALKSALDDVGLKESVFRLLWSYAPAYKYFDTGDKEFKSGNHDRVAVAEVIQAPCDLVLTIGTGYQFVVLLFSTSSESSYSSNTGWLTEYKIAKDTYFGVQIKNDAGSATLALDDFWRVNAIRRDVEQSTIDIQGLLNNNIFKSLWTKVPTNQYFDTASTSFKSSTKRAVIAEIIQAPFDIPLEVASGYDLNVCYFSSASTSSYTTNTGWVKNAIVPKGSYFVVNVKNTSNTNISADSIWNVTARRYLEATEEGTILDYNKSEQNSVITAKRRVNTTRNSFASKPPVLSLLHFSDIHEDETALQNIVKFKEKMVSYIDDAICTGDMVTTWGKGMSWWNDMSGTSKILLCIGNHEIQTSANTTEDYGEHYSIADAYGRYFSTNISNWGVQYTADLTYYYKDYADNKVRLIVLDSLIKADASAISAQNTWLANTLAGAKTLGYSVIIATHFSNRADKTAIESNFTMIDHAPESSILLSTYCDTVQSFIEGGGDFICYISGHEHLDYILTCEAYPSQIVVCIGECKDEDLWGDLEREAGTKSADLFNIIAVDTYAKNMKLIRIGADRDVYMRHRGTLVLNWQTRQIKYFD